LANYIITFFFFFFLFLFLGLSASVEATRRCAARQHDLLAFADDLSTAGDDVRQSALHLIATLAQCAALPVTPSSAADDLLRLAALKADASRHWRNAVAATHAVRGAADRFRARLAANDGGSQAAVQNQAVRDLKAADERVAALSQQIAADKSAADAATKREAALKLETARLDALAKQLTSQLDAANAQVSVLEQQLTTAKSSATAAAAAAAAAAATAAAAAATPAAPAAATAATTTTSVVSLQNASSEQLAQFASDVSLKAKSDVLKEALRSASKAADELVSATLNPSSDVSAFVAAAKASAAAMTRPLQLAVQILTAAKQLPVYQYEGGAEDAELLVRYRRAIFDLISEAKRIRSGDEGEQSAGVAERDALLLEHRRSAVKMQLFFFGKTVEQVIYSGIWL
jgi:hypothetical protein